MRIWILTSELPSDTAGGIARYVVNFARLLGQAGHEVTVIACSKQACDEISAPGVRTIGFETKENRLGETILNPDSSAHPGYPYNILSYWPALSYQVAEEVLGLLSKLPPPDIIESQEYNALSYFLLQRKLTGCAALQQIPIINHLHSPNYKILEVNQEPRYQFPNYWIGRMERFCLCAADGLVSPSQFLADEVRHEVNPEQEIRVIPYPLLFEKGSRYVKPVPGKITFAGRLELRKGVIPLLKACDRLWESGRAFQMSLVGGETRYRLKDMDVGDYIRHHYAHWIESGSLKLTGQQPQSEVLSEMRRAWAVVIPSLWDNFPNTCMEAMAAGQVALVSRAGGQAEMVAESGENGFIFDWEQPGDFEEKLEQVLALSPAEHRRISEQAQKRILGLCHPQEILARRLEHFEYIIAAHTPRRHFPAPAPSPSPTPFLIQKEAGCSPSSFAPYGEGEEKGLLSIIIPYYNLGKYIQDTLDSALHNTYQPHEIIILNDGSTDPFSIRKLQRIEAHNLPGVRVIHQSNQGLPLARNNGVQAARGEFIAFLDSDDMVEAQFYEQAIGVLQRYSNVDLVYSWVNQVMDQKNNICSVWPTWNLEIPYLLGHNMLVPITVIRRQAFLRYGLNKLEPAATGLEDYESWISMAEAGCIGVSLPDPLVRYRVRPDSMYAGIGWATQLVLFDHISRQHPDLYQRWGLELFNLLNANGPSWRWNNPAITPPKLSMNYVQQLERNSIRFRVLLQKETLKAKSMRAELEWKEGELSRLNDDLQSSRQISCQLRLDLENLLTARKELQEAAHQSERQRDQLTLELARLTTEHSQLWEEAQRLAHGWEEQRDFIRQVEKNRDSIWSELQELEQRCEEQRRRLEDVQNQYSQLSNQPMVKALRKLNWIK